MNHYINQFLEENEKKMISIRRYLHEYPELSFKEIHTSNYISDYYLEKDCIVDKDPNSNGVVVTINGAEPGNTIGIRADFDALPIQEETGLSFSSKNDGVMHACGHDGHTAYLMVLADALITHKDKWNGTIKIIHQAAEEIPPGGAVSIVNSGLIDDVDFFVGAHVWSLLPLGTISSTPGNIMTRRDHFSVVFKGAGGHGSAPHLAKDTNLAVAFFQTAVQSIISRRIDPLEPATLTIGSVEGAGSFNIIQEVVNISGDIRTFNSNTSEKIKEEFIRILNGISIMFDIKFELKYSHDYEEVYNDPIKINEVTKIIEKVNLPDDINLLTDYKVTASEDFCYYRRIAPSCFLLIGAKPENGMGYPHHHPKFNINEKSLLLAAKIMGAIALNFLNND